MSIIASGRNIVEVVFEVDGFYIHCVALAGYGLNTSLTNLTKVED